mmetsp:Transcript_38354/g.41576  ORF Transcript_38354/g.41576 Transcript_38354/m.41576 type:complete len:894 (-) Transcript_38354:433-3114(-)
MSYCVYSLFKIFSIYIIFWTTPTSISITTTIIMASWTTKVCTAFSTGTTTVSTSTRSIVTSRRRITGSSSRIRQRASSPLLLPSWQLASTTRIGAGGAASSRTYSQATKDRIQGLNAETEFTNLSKKMKTAPSELQILLMQRLAAASTSTATASIDDSDSIGGWTEKEEYLDWLLSGASNRKKTKTKTNITTKKKNNRPMPSITSRTSRTLQDLNSSNSNSSRSRAFGTNADSTNTHTENENTKTQQTFHTEIRFDDPTTIQLDPLLLQGVAKMGLTQMTEIQSKTFVAASTGNDVLGRARTGTGKTVAFLLPALQRLLNEGKVDDPNSVGMLIVSPTRELASQIGEQAKQLLQYQNGASVQVMFGGTNMKTDVNRLSGTSRNKGSKSGLPTVLVATPGRLLDHLRSTKLRDPNSNNIISFGKDIMKRTCQILVLDETDRLLDMGFRNDIENIMQFLPPSSSSTSSSTSGRGVGRQTLLFSATIPQDLKVIMKKHMNAKYQEIDCVQDGDAATQTNASVQQTHLIAAKNADSVTAVIETIHYSVESHYETDVIVPPKIVVFFPTARLVQFYAEIFHEVTGGVSVNVIDHNNDNEYNTDATNKKRKAVKLQSWELHSKKSQGYRNRVSEEFRQAKTGVLFTSDVSARGVDYPNVSQVIQCGMPESRDQYIHRLGRTGRAGQQGTGWLLLQAWEAPFLKELQGVDIPVNTLLQARLQQRMNDSRESDDGTELEERTDTNDATSMMVQELHRRVRGRDGILSKSAEQAYAAFLGYYKGQMKRMTLRNSEELVRTANDFATSSGFVQGPPALQKSTVSKMGLKGVPGLNISSHSSTGGGGRGGGGGRNGGGRGGSSGSGRGGGGRGGRGRGRSEQSFDRGGGGRDSIGRRFRQGQDR